MAKMREQKLRKKMHNLSAEQGQQISAWANTLNAEAAIRRRVQLIVHVPANQKLACRRTERRRRAVGVKLDIRARMRGRNSKVRIESADGRDTKTFVMNTQPEKTSRFFSFAAMVGLCEQLMKNRSNLACMYGCSRMTVMRVQCCGALVLLCSQLLVLKSIRECIDKSQRKLDFCIMREAWDETGERVVLNIGETKGFSQEQQASCWQVMVCRMSLCWGWLAGLQSDEDSDDLHDEWTGSMDIVVPPMPLRLCAPNAQYAPFLSYRFA